MLLSIVLFVNVEWYTHVSIQSNFLADSSVKGQYCELKLNLILAAYKASSDL